MRGAAIFTVRRLYLGRVLNGSKSNSTSIFVLFYCFYLRISLHTGLIITQALEVVEVDLGI